MKITKIEQQKKNPQRYSVFIDDEYAFGVYEEVFIRAHLKIGIEMSQEKIAQLKSDDEYQIAWQKSLAIIGRSKKSEKDMRTKLKDFESVIIDKTIERLKEYKLINDEDFARSLTNDCINIRRYSVRAIRQKLFQKGIAPEIIDCVLADVDGEQIDDNISMLVQKKIRVGKNREQIMRYLASKGYGWDEIKQGLENY